MKPIADKSKRIKLRLCSLKVIGKVVPKETKITPQLSKRQRRRMKRIDFLRKKTELVHPLMATMMMKNLQKVKSPPKMKRKTTKVKRRITS